MGRSYPGVSWFPLAVIAATVAVCSPQVQTETECEHQNLTITCDVDDGKVLKIYDAMYGRMKMDTMTCPHEQAMTNEDCRASSSLEIVEGKCENETSCTVLAGNSVFGDPCKGVFKYLRVEYTCVRVCGLNDKCDAVTQVCVDGGDCVCAENYESTGDGVCRGVDSPTTWPMSTVPGDADTTQATAESPVTEEIPPPACPADVIYISGIMLTFPAAESGNLVSSSERCPEASANAAEPLATRFCGESWEDPMMTECYDEETLETQLAELAQMNVTDENVAEVAGMLVLTSSQTDDISPEGLGNIITTLDSVVAVQNPSVEVTDSVVGVANNVMALNETMLADSRDVNGIVPLLETQIRQVHRLGKNYTEILPNVGTSALQLGVASLEQSVLYEDPFMGAFGSGEENATPARSSISLPPSVLDLILAVDPDITTVPVSFLAYRDSALFQSPPPNTDPDAPVVVEYVEGQIIAATVELENLKIEGLPANSSVITTFSRPATLEEGNSTNTTTEFICVYWGHRHGEAPRWSPEGCRRISPEGDEIVCACDHLTSFAVLVRVSGNPKGSERFQLALDIITVVGCVLSIIGLSFCVVAMLILRSVRTKQQTHVHFNLCLALLGLYLSFLLGVDKSDQPELCRAMTSVIYFFCVSSVAWMAVEGFYIYMLIWKYKRNSIRHLIAFAVVLAWGLPAVAAILICILDKSHDYVAEADYCFLHPGPTLYYGFLLEVFILYTYNLVIFILVTYRVNSRKIRYANKEDKRHEMLTRVKSTFLFWVILGMAWLFGFLATFHSPVSLVFQVLFCVCLSLQGFFMFYMLFVQNPEIKKEIQSVTSRHSSNSGSGDVVVGNGNYTTKPEPSQGQIPSNSTFDNQTYSMEVNPVSGNIYYEVNT